MPDSEDPKEVTNYELPDAKFGGGLINAESVNAGRIGGDITNIIQNVTFQKSGLSGEQAIRSLLERDPPFLLAYLANRREQELELRDVFEKALKQAKPCYLVCIIHGEESQSHYSFLQRLKNVYFPRFLSSNPEEIKIQEYHLEWPSRFKKLDNLRNNLYMNLVDSILGYSSVPPEKCNERINDIFGRYSNPVIVHTHLITEDWQHQGFKILDKLLEFWQDLHNKIITQKLIICIFIKYKAKRKKTTNKRWFKWTFNFWRDSLKGYRYQKTNRMIREYLQKRCASNFTDFNPLNIIVLPELEGVSKKEVEDWARSEFVKNIVNEAMIDLLINKIGEMFDSWEEQNSSETIPMNDLADKLNNLLKSLLTAKGGLA